MTHLTQTYLESLGFQLHWSQEHGYRAQYTRYDADVTRSISLISQTDCITDLRKHDYDLFDVLFEPSIKFDVWFWGQTSDGRYAEIDSHMTISSVEELEILLSYLRD